MTFKFIYDCSIPKKDSWLTFCWRWIISRIWDHTTSSLCLIWVECDILLFSRKDGNNNLRLDDLHNTQQCFTVKRNTVPFRISVGILPRNHFTSNTRNTLCCVESSERGESRIMQNIRRRTVHSCWIMLWDVDCKIFKMVSK